MTNKKECNGSGTIIKVKSKDTINNYIKKRIKEITSINISKVSRQREIVEYRALYCFLLRKYSNQSLTEIGKSISKNHATVIHALKNYEMYEIYNEKVRITRSKIEDELANQIEFTISSKTLSQELLSLNYELREELNKYKKLEKYLNAPDFLINLLDNYNNYNNFERAEIKEKLDTIASRYQVENCSNQ